MFDLSQDIGPVKGEKTVGIDLTVAEILELNLELALQFRKQALLEDEDLLLGGLGGGIGPR